MSNCERRPGPQQPPGRNPNQRRIPIIGFGHKSRVGKDTAARAIVEALSPIGETRPVHMSFAHMLKRDMHRRFRHYGVMSPEHYEDHPRDRSKPLERLGGVSYIDLLIEYGGFLRSLHPQAIADAVLLADVLPHDPTADAKVLRVVSDVRDPVYEARAIQAMGGWVVRIDRPDEDTPVYGLDSLFPEDFQWDVILVNDGTVEDLEEQAIKLAYDYLLGSSRPGREESLSASAAMFGRNGTPKGD